MAMGKFLAVVCFSPFVTFAGLRLEVLPVIRRTSHGKIRAVCTSGMKQILLLTAQVMLVGMIAGAWIGSRREHDAYAEQVGRLRRAGALEMSSIPVGQADNLPPPVARYLRRVLPATALIQEVWLRQVGVLKADLDSDRWMPFEAEHIVVPPATGFVWKARVRVAPMLHISVRDALIDRGGSGHVSLLSAFALKSDGGTMPMNSGSLHRYLAEAVWYPTALLPGPNLRWSPIDATRSLATLTNGKETVSLEFRFAASGEVTGIYTPGRWGTFDEGYRQVPWEGHFRNYREWNGVVVPTEGDVGWQIHDEWQTVWKGRVTTYEVRLLR